MDDSFFFVADDQSAGDFHPERADAGTWYAVHGLSAIECQFLWNVLRQDDNPLDPDGLTEFAMSERIWVWRFSNAFTQRLANRGDAAAVAQQVISIPGIQGTTLHEAAKSWTLCSCWRARRRLEIRAFISRKSPALESDVIGHCGAATRGRKPLRTATPFQI